MSLLHNIASGLRSLFRKKQDESELDEELRGFLESAIEEKMKRGMSREEAARAVRLERGNLEVTKEAVRDSRWESFLQISWQDFRFAARTLRKNPGFAEVAVLTLALGIGASTALFSVVNGVLLNPLPYPHPEQLVEVAAKAPPFSESSFSYPNFLDWVKENHTFDALAGYRANNLNLTGSGEAQHLLGMQVSASFFSLLGVQPFLGQDFRPEDDQRGAAPVAMLSYGLWKSKFASSRDILGKTLILNGKVHTVVGVLPANFYFCCEAFNFHLGDVYLPIGVWDNPAMLERSDHMGIYAVGRMKPGVTVEQARADMDRVAEGLAAEYPNIDKNEGVWIMPLKQRMVQDVKLMLFVLLAAVGFVLLIACANVANLLLARSTKRAKELAIRLAMGATRGRIVRQLLTESLLLSIAGGGLGLLFAWCGTRAGLKVLPEALPRANDVHIDPRVLLFTLVVSIFAGVLFGLAPALKTSRLDLQKPLKEAGRGASVARHRTQTAFVVFELALAAVLLIGAGLTVRTLAALWSVNPGFNPRNVLTFTVSVPASKEKETPEEIRANLRRLTATLAAVPGVQAASTSDGAQPMGGDEEWPLWIEGRPKPQSRDEMVSALSYIVDPGYWEVMEIPLVRGRLLNEQDDARSRPVCVIDEHFAAEYFPKENPIGQRLNIEGADQQYEIVGVVGHVNQWGLDSDLNGPVKAQFYSLVQQFPDKWMSSPSFSNHAFVVRSSGADYPGANAIHKALQDMNSAQVAFDFGSMEEIVSDSLAARRFTMILLAVFAGMAVLLASIGIYGVVSYVVGQRTHEIGIRMALGAKRSNVLLMVIGQAGTMVALGVVVGLIASLGLTRLLAGMLVGVNVYDLPTFLGVAIVLPLVALLACYVPARRASRVDPMVALRYE
jgi:predicted permease